MKKLVLLLSVVVMVFSITTIARAQDEVEEKIE